MGIPVKIRVSTAAAQAAQYDGELSFTALPRLRELLADTKGGLQVHLSAGMAGGRATFSGSISGGLWLSCKRCGAHFVWPLQSEVDWRVVRNEAEEREVLSDHEPVVVEDDELPLREVIEDEVLLSLPMLPRCETCENEVAALPEVAPVPLEETPRPAENPFAALKKQLKSD